MDASMSSAGASCATSTNRVNNQDLVEASRRYEAAQIIKETIYEAEGAFPGKAPSISCSACQGDDSVTERQKSRLFACKQGLVLHINGSFHSGYSRWRRLRTQDALQILALGEEGIASPHAAEVMTTSESSGPGNGNGQDSEKKARSRLRFYCPYPFCGSDGKGWESVDKLIAHVQGSSVDSDILNHEQQKWSEGWSDGAWLVNEDAARMIEEVKRMYPG